MHTPRAITAVVVLILYLPAATLHGAQPQHGSTPPKTAAPSFTMPRAKGFTAPQSAARPGTQRAQPSLPSVTRTQPKFVPSQPTHAAGSKAFEPKGWGHTTPTPSIGAGPSRRVPPSTAPTTKTPPVTLKPGTLPRTPRVSLPTPPSKKPTWPATTDVVHTDTPAGPVTHPSNPAQPQPPVFIALPIPVPSPAPEPPRPRQPYPPVTAGTDVVTTPGVSFTTEAKSLPVIPVREISGTPRKHEFRSNAIMAAQIRSWQAHTECLPFGGTPDVNGNGIPDYVYDSVTQQIVLNPAEPDSDGNGFADVGSVDADGNGSADLGDWENVLFQGLIAAGINPLADDDANGVPNAVEALRADHDGDGIVDFNDATPCGDQPADPNGANGIAGGGNGGPLFFPIPIPIPVPMPGLPGGGLVGIGPQPGLPLAAEPPVERSVLVATAGDVDADSDNSSAAQEPDHSVAEEQVEDGDVGLLVLVSTADDRHRAPLDVKLPAAGARTLVRFHDAGSHLALFTSDPLEHPEARRLDFDRDYPVADLGFAADVFRRLYVESTAAGRDAVSVEIDVAGDGTWAPVDGLMITSQSTAADVVGGLPVESAPPQAQIQANQSFLLPAQGIGSEPGKVAITFGAATFDCSVEKWTSSALQARVAAVPLTAAADGTLVITLADGRVAASIPVRVAPAAAEPAAITQAALGK